MPEYSMAQIKAAYIQKKDWEKQFPVSYYVFRPLSFYLTFLIVRITGSASAVAWFGLIVGLLASVSLVAIHYITIWPGIILLALFALLDAVDGNIARVTKTVTYYGKYLDGVIGMLVESIYFLWLGVGLYLSSQEFRMFGSRDFHLTVKSFVIIAGAVILFCKLCSSLIENMYDNLYIQKQKDEGKFHDSLTNVIQSSTYRGLWWHEIYVNLNAFNLQVLLLAVSAVFGVIHLFLLFFALYYFVRMLTVMVFYFRRGKDRLG